MLVVNVTDLNIRYHPHQQQHQQQQQYQQQDKEGHHQQLADMADYEEARRKYDKCD